MDSNNGHITLLPIYCQIYQTHLTTYYFNMNVNCMNYKKITKLLYLNQISILVKFKIVFYQIQQKMHINSQNSKYQ